jgi:uncharacterized membrane protein
MYYSGFGIGSSSIVIFILAVVAAALIAYFFLNAARRDTYKGFGSRVSGLFNFTKYLVPMILKFLYAFATAFAVLNGLYILFSGNFFGLVYLIVGPIVVRIGFELTMLMYSIHEELVRVRKAAESKADREARQEPPQLG